VNMPRIGKKVILNLAAFFLFAIPAGSIYCKVITVLPGPSVALTFDCCETVTPSFFDHTILDFLLADKIPFTLFVSGKFARRNAEELRTLSRLDVVEIENHSMHHVLHMERLPDAVIALEVRDAENILFDITGKRPRYFRFPGGNYNDRALRDVESMNYRVVHWSFASGDPDKNITPEKLTRWVLLKTQPGSILIFHINGRGFSTGKALPGIIEALHKRGYRFVKLEDALETGK
jgi:peptidoglycan-N-acetylglucosamine deacetylase